MVPLRGIVLFPHMMLNFDVGRERSLHAIELAMEQDSLLLLCAQHRAETEDPTPQDIHAMGTVARVRQIVRLPNDGVRVTVQGLYRARIASFLQDDPCFITQATLEDVPIKEDEATSDALMRTLMDLYEKYGAQTGKVTPEALLATAYISDMSELADTVAAAVVKKVTERQQLLEITDPGKRMDALQTMLAREIEIQSIEQKINQRVKSQVDRSQKEYYLNEQIRAIQSELGNDDASEIDELKRRAQALDVTDDIRERLLKEITRMSKLSPSSPEMPIARAYVDTLLDLPWGVLTEDNLDITHAQKVLNEDHYGLDKVKERVLEYLAVRKLSRNLRGPILCFVGPPGVGKTSIARSIARAMGRKFVRMSLGGVHDEAEIRGHRRTYIGAMPGRILSNIKLAGSSNPVFLFDELDKLGNDYRGDPASAMLEVLDPEQNTTFRDNFLEVPYDLSNVLFLTTANTLETVPDALRDRMEVIYLPGYTEEEKLHIARRHLLPRQMQEHGLDTRMLSIPDEVLKIVIDKYTREAGVRQLERELAGICRKAARQIAEKGTRQVRVMARSYEKYLGKPKYLRDDAQHVDTVGLATGLAWTEVGGETLDVEVIIMPGTGKLELTGQLGDVMKESAQAALSYIRSHAADLGVSPDFHKDCDIHVHIPEGATPKDGPSAGITLATAIVSALTGMPARAKVAMTGEITLRGRVLPIGGLKEKSMAAYREGISTVLIPQQNLRDIKDIPEGVRKKLNFIPVETLNDVFGHALVK